MSAVVVAGPQPPAKRRSLPREVIPFQGDVTAIEAQPVPLWARSTILLVAVALALGFVWAAYAPLDKVIRAPGKLVTIEPKLIMAPLETAVVRGINVKPGDAVKAGEVVAQLDATFATADTASLQHRLAATEAQIARLTAELSGANYAPAADTPENGRERVLFERRRAEHNARLLVFEKRTTELNAQLRGTETELTYTRQQLKLAREVEAMRKDLWDTQTNSKLQLLGASANRLDLEQTAASAGDRLQRLKEQLASVAAERAAYTSEWYRDVADALAKAEVDRDSLREELAKAERRRSLVDLRAPVDGVVLEVNERFSLGSVVQAAESVMTLVPDDATLEVEAEIEARDVGEIRVGDPVRIKLDAFPFQRHGVVQGVVRDISDDAFPPPEGQASLPGLSPRLVYRARIELTDTTLRDVRPDLRLLPGMTLSSEIKVGSRTVLSYVLYPIIRNLDESLKEP